MPLIIVGRGDDDRSRQPVSREQQQTCPLLGQEAWIEGPIRPETCLQSPSRPRASKYCRDPEGDVSGTCDGRIALSSARTGVGEKTIIAVVVESAKKAARYFLINSSLVDKQKRYAGRRPADAPFLSFSVLAFSTTRPRSDCRSGHWEHGSGRHLAASHYARRMQ